FRNLWRPSMVRTNSNQNEPIKVSRHESKRDALMTQTRFDYCEQSDEKETTIKKKSTQKKRIVVTGVWPCKINGCNKQFAREADLKRHQRTTKLHSMPSWYVSFFIFDIPRVQLSAALAPAPNVMPLSQEHNGVVIEASDKDDNEDDGSSGSHSRSATPSSKGKEKESESSTTAQSAPTTQHNGPSPYYRQHTLTTTPYVPRQVVMAPHYPQVSLPTSATRLNVPTQWSYPPLPDGAGTQQMSYPPTYYPSPHYRQNAGQEPANSNTQPMSAPGPSQGAPGTQKTPTMDTDNSLSVDSSLDPNESVQLTAEQISTLAKLLEEQRERTSRESRAGSASTTAFSETDRDTTVTGSQDDNDLGEGTSKTHAMHDYGPPLDRPEPMEHMLTEDGEPMLNPGL
ncbi:hypothetical protein H0H92_007288, partial [Tricholoma furcatifolium]